MQVEHDGGVEGRVGEDGKGSVSSPNSQSGPSLDVVAY